MSYLGKLDAVSVLICPHCGKDEFITGGVPRNTMRCADCGLNFYISRAGTELKNDELVGYRKVAASLVEMKSEDEWDWKMTIYPGRVTVWKTWSGQYESEREDKRSLEEVKDLIAQKWEAQKVVLALTSNFKK